jgi:FMN phosphatase YigB (HAD superfamily)
MPSSGRSKRITSPNQSANNNGIKAIIFDLGNVLVDFDHNLAAKKVSQFSDKSPQEIFSFFFDSELVGLFEEGKVSAIEFFSKIKKSLNLRLDYGGFVPIWNEIFFLSSRNKEVYSLAKELKKRYVLAILSNINILHFDYIKKEFPVFDVFHYIITSFELGVQKPKPEIYRKALGILKVKPEEAFYTDDRQELVDKSREIGIKGFVFKNPEQLKNDLLDSGIYID